MTHDTFLSYSRVDGVAALALRKRLTGAGLTAFLDRYGLPAGQAWQPWLERALAACGSLVVLLGPGGVATWQHREIQLGLERQGAEEKAGRLFPVIPVLLPGITADALPVGRFLGLNTWVDLRHEDDPEALQRLVAGIQGRAIDDTAAKALLASVAPYRGLLPFREEDAGLFFGRERFVTELVEKVGQRSKTNVVAVLGRSGSGKSSIVTAGLLPALRRERGGGRSAVWNILELRPLAEPLHELARAFAPPPEGDPIAAREHVNANAARLRKGKGKVTVAQLVHDRLAAEPGSTRQLLYVDQWEELYTQAQPREIRTKEDRRRADDVRRFIDLLLDAAASAPCTLVLTVRSDFYPDLQIHDRLCAAVQHCQVSLGPIRAAELQDAIEGPARAVGGQIAPELTRKLIRDIGRDVAGGRSDQYDIGKLPLLEYALEQAWKKRNGASIGLAQYAGLEEELENWANKLYDSLKPDQQRAAKQLFVSLVTPGEGREDTRARVTLTPAIQEVADIFAGGQARLIVTGDSANGRMAEVSHEALIRHWAILRKWVDENRANLRIRSDLEANREHWIAKGRHIQLLIPPGLRLEQARKLRADPGDVVIDGILDYIDASVEADGARTAEEHQRRRNELHAVRRLAEEQRLRAETEKRRADAEQRHAIEQAALATAALEQWRRAEERESLRLAEQSRLETANGRALTGLLLALEALPTGAGERGPSAGILPWNEQRQVRPIIPQALSALIAALRTPREVAGFGGHTNTVTSVAFSTDGSRVASGSSDKTIRVWDVAAGKEIVRLEGHTEYVNSVAFSPDGRLLASGSSDTTIRLWDVAAGKEIDRLKGHTSDVKSIAFSADGSRLASGSDDNTIRLWDVAWGRAIALLEGHTNTVSSVAFSADGSRLASGSWDRTLRLWDMTAGEEIALLEGHTASVNSVAFSPDGSRLASGSWDATIRLWEVAAGEEIARLEGHIDRVTSVAFSPDGRRLASSSRDKTIRLWDVAAGKEIVRLEGHTDRVTSVAFSSSGSRLASGSSDKTIRLWDLVIPVATVPVEGQAAIGLGFNRYLVWELTEATLPEIAFAVRAALPRCLSDEERRHFFLPRVEHPPSAPGQS